jgi:signal transduction histidine kinase
MTGLTLGVTVDERARAEAGLHSSLRLAAAGQMAAALAHELSQPLTALSTYAQACQILVEDARDLPREQRRQLMDVTGRMVNDVNRAGDVIKRLRDFFRTGSTRLAPTDPVQLVQEALQVHQRRALAAGLQLESTLDEDLPQVWMDPVQISIVLRNLIDNAIDSVRTAGPGGFVRIDVRTSGTDLLIEVRDSGPGVDPARMPKLFESGPSDKPGGMGLGLSICRSIVDAHGGRLWAEPGPGGLFRVTLPLEGNTTSGATDAR